MKNQKSKSDNQCDSSELQNQFENLPKMKNKGGSYFKECGSMQRVSCLGGEEKPIASFNGECEGSTTGELFIGSCLVMQVYIQHIEAADPELCSTCINSALVIQFSVTFYTTYICNL